MRKRMSLLVLLIAGSIGPVSGQSSPNGQTPRSLIQGQPRRTTASCEGLASLTVPNATITLARVQRVGMDRHGMDRVGSSDWTRPVSVPRL
jgi:hypothetical protein